ncbi:hypothetical protein Mp_2g23150 [Marchantia polymorpha subsp. ruderalis]|uniref:Bromo domain-containing protein n=1 Tax=Marchantia polymorpha TaxID=3197 RepID=A0A2R6WN22_MARPO|nr:hypothetical protein MARPO_0072s0016 [Marchantia polymorpha]BBN03394.1 hypothetical protein Mp_2g23150 [Marchantia polymorpha subsp. ruderalis]|eukprot:PTQ35253.1 hypothetical protein MARPO_0072s0016 [Marchantia polymorpha]
MTEFVMGPSVVPALQLVALRQLPKNSLLNGTQDERNGGYNVGEESMACLTNLADSSGCPWSSIGCHWSKQTAEKSSGCLVLRKSNGLEELFCAVAQQSEVGFLSDRKSDSTGESKSSGADNLICISDGEVRISCKRKAYVHNGGRLKGDIASERDDTMDTGTYQLDHDRKDNCGQHSPECNTSHLKPQVEKLGWKNGRHAENRRKRWAQSDPMLDIWKAVSASRHAAPFRRPVALLDDYNSIIRQPIDLSTIRRQLESDESYNLESLRRDLMLMVTNALVYNKSGTETYDMAVKLKAHACRLFEGDGKDSILFGYKASSLGNSSKSAVKVSKAKAALQNAAELFNECESLPLAPVKKHRTMRRPRTCINNDGGGLRSDVANGAAMDNISEEEAAAVLICFSSGQAGDEKHAPSMSKVAKLESPRKRLKRVETEIDESYSCSDTPDDISHTDHNLMAVNLSIMTTSLRPATATSLRGIEIRPMLEESEKYRYWTAMDISQTKKFENLGVSVSVINEDPRGTSTISNRDENAVGNQRSERTCMGLKHKWQERWRMQSAASSESSGPMQQSSDAVGVNTFVDKYSMEDGSGAETNYRPFPQTAGAYSSVAPLV